MCVKAPAAVSIVLRAPFKKLKPGQPKARQHSLNISGDKGAPALNIFRDNEVLIPSGSTVVDNAQRAGIMSLFQQAPA